LESIIHVNDASVRFNIASEKIESIKEYFVKFFKGTLHFREFLALKNINFEIKRGESWGIIGSNGAGKSTLLRLICGIIAPSKGSIIVNGSISPILELGAGFDGDLTAKENIYLQGALLGHSHAFMQEHYNSIVEFSELSEFLDMPIKNYSTGMQARMAFSVATVVKPEILIIDEALSVGDAAFQRKCSIRIQEMLQGNTTLILVSHDNTTIENLCENAIWLRNGELVLSGKSHEVCTAYSEYFK